MKKNNLIYLLLFSLIFISCTNDSQSDLLEDIDTTTVTYTANIKSIIDNNCNSCHSAPPVNYAPMSLVTYPQVKTWVENGGINDRISRNQGASGMMPLGGTRLPQQSINLIIEWQNQGFLE
jgi:uncharacterized membrane protein